MDKVIVCRDCGAEFTFSKNEQEFYAEKGFNAPVRCKSCREARKAANAAREQKQSSPWPESWSR